MLVIHGVLCYFSDLAAFIYIAVLCAHMQYLLVTTNADRQHGWINSWMQWKSALAPFLITYKIPVIDSHTCTPPELCKGLEICIRQKQNHT